MSTRREFLKFAALSGAALLSSSFSFSQEKKDDDTNTIDMLYIDRRPAPPRRIVIPDVEGFKVLKGDFHMHTLFSDGLVMPKDRVAEAVDNGMDVISITDHIEYRPFFGGKGIHKLQDRNDDLNLTYDVAKPEADKAGLLLVRGAEVTKGLPPGHFNTLFVEDINPINAVVDDWRAMLQVAVDQGGFILWNHPGWESSKGIPKNGPIRFFPEHEEIFKKGLLHGIEVFNHCNHYPVVSDWCNRMDLAMLADSDIHKSEWNLYGHQNPLRPFTMVLARERSVESVKEAFFAKRTLGCAAGMVWGRDPWLPALFKVSVKVEQPVPGKLVLTNESSLPCLVRAGGIVRELPTNRPTMINRARGIDTFTVENWMIGMNKPLTVPIEV